MAAIKTLLALAGSLIVSSVAGKTGGCGTDLPPVQTKPSDDPCVDSHLTKFTQSNDQARTYRIHIPSNYNKNTPVPLIFSFHGHGKTACGQERLSEFSDEKLNPDAIAVYPQGLKDSNGTTQWQGDPYSPKRLDDIGFTQDMINEFSNFYCIDDSRIYSAGKSNGRGFTGVLACDPTLSTKTAAFAPVSGAFYVPGSSADNCDAHEAETITIPCRPGRKDIPILEFHGSKDDTIWYKGGPRKGECLPTIPHWVEE